MIPVYPIMAWRPQLDMPVAWVANSSEYPLSHLVVNIHTVLLKSSYLQRPHGSRDSSIT